MLRALRSVPCYPGMCRAVRCVRGRLCAHLSSSLPPRHDVLFVAFNLPPWRGRDVVPDFDLAAVVPVELAEGPEDALDQRAVHLR